MRSSCGNRAGTNWTRRATRRMTSAVGAYPGAADPGVQNGLGIAGRDSRVAKKRCTQGMRGSSRPEACDTEMSQRYRDKRYSRRNKRSSALFESRLGPVS